MSPSRPYRLYVLLGIAITAVLVVLPCCSAGADRAKWMVNILTYV